VSLHKVVFLKKYRPADLPGSYGKHETSKQGTERKRIATNILAAFVFNSMKAVSYSALFILFAALLLFTAGCTSTQTPGAAAPAPAGTVAPAPQQAAAPSAVAGAVTKSANIDTTIGVRFNDFTCINIQDQIGAPYLYPDQKITLTAAPPSGGGVNVNVLVVDENDQIGFRQIAPQWDAVQKTWVYAGIVPLIQLNDVTSPVAKTVTIKTQSKYYLCVDDRKESGSRDTIYQVPVTLLKS
jgi:hypothetical protein